MDARRDALRNAIRFALTNFTEELTEALAENIYNALGPDGQLQLQQARQIEDLKEAFWKSQNRVKTLENDIIALDAQLARARRTPLDTTSAVV